MYTRNFLTALLLLLVLPHSHNKNTGVGTWACAPQTVDKRFMPYNNQMNNRAVRQIVKVSIGGKTIRLKLSNELSTTPVEIESVYIAQAENGSDIRKGKVGYLKFSGKDGVTPTCRKSNIL